MFEVEVGDKKLVCEVSFLTMQIYEAEFMSNIIHDLFGKVSDDGGELTFETAFGDDGEPDVKLVGIDFTKVKWSAVLQALWAMCKTADETTPGYPTWASRLSGANLWDVRELIVARCGDCFFRPGAADEKQ